MAVLRQDAISSELILASESPRRRELLQRLGFRLRVHPAAIDESPLRREPARRYVERMARKKAEGVASLYPGRWVLAADTAVVLGIEILGKPGSELAALRMLQRLSGRAHSVLTAVALEGPSRDLVSVKTQVWFRTLSPREMRWYVRTGEPMDKAGAYAVQGTGAFLIQSIRGSFSNVIGLPLSETLVMLERAGISLPWNAA